MKSKLYSSIAVHNALYVIKNGRELGLAWALGRQSVTKNETNDDASGSFCKRRKRSILMYYYIMVDFSCVFPIS
jgi:hypothetical protein